MLVVAGLGVIIALARAARRGARRALRLLAARLRRALPDPGPGRRERHAAALRRLPAHAADGARRALPAARDRGPRRSPLALAYNVMPYANAVSSRIDSRASDRALLGAGAAPTCTTTAAAPSASRSSRPPTTGRPGGSRAPASRSPAAGTGRWTSPRTARCTATRSRRRAYRHWLRRMAVRYVMLPSLPLGKKGADREALLLHDGVDGLRLVYRRPTGASGRSRTRRRSSPARRTCTSAPSSTTASRCASRSPARTGWPCATCRTGRSSAARSASGRRADGMTLLDVRRAGPPAARRGGRSERARPLAAQRQPTTAAASSLHGAIAAGHPLTAEAGARALEAGGTAVDACLAAAFTSWVAESPLTGAGGGGFMLVHTARDDATRLLDFFVAVPGPRTALGRGARADGRGRRRVHRRRRARRSSGSAPPRTPSPARSLGWRLRTRRTARCRGRS